jgi:hypothetical protein
MESMSMKRKIATLLLMSMICVGGTACGNKAESTADTSSEVTSVEEDVVAADVTEETPVEENVEEIAAEETTADSTDATEEVSDEEGKYVVFTDASNEEVEAFAKTVVDAVLAKDWETVGDMIQYPIGTEEANNLCNNKEEFVAYANSTGFSEENMTSLAAWDSADLWANWQGACIDDGNIWFRDIDIEKKDFKIVSLFDLREAGGEITD